MSAESVVQAAALVAVRAVAGLNGVYPGAPIKATVPYAELGDVLSIDWSVKDRAGRELRIGVTVRDASDTPVRVHLLAEGVCDAIEGLPRDLADDGGGWRVASVTLVKSRAAGGPAGRWTATVEYRVRVLAA